MLNKPNKHVFLTLTKSVFFFVVVLVLVNPNQTRSTVMSQHEIEKLNLKKCKVAMCIHGFQKHTPTTFIYSCDLVVQFFNRRLGPLFEHLIRLVHHL